jgi:hypothetical protein
VIEWIAQRRLFSARSVQWVSNLGLGLVRLRFLTRPAAAAFARLSAPRGKRPAGSPVARHHYDSLPPEILDEVKPHVSQHDLHRIDTPGANDGKL